MGAALAAIVAFAGAGGCDETQNAWNCSDLCNRYQDCFDQNYDVNACNTRCQTVQTDCNLRCDGNIPCINQCQVSADTCADSCLKQ